MRHLVAAGTHLLQLLAVLILYVPTLVPVYQFVSVIYLPCCVHHVGAA
jgi:hypothetical protein